MAIENNIFLKTLQKKFPVNPSTFFLGNKFNIWCVVIILNYFLKIVHQCSSNVFILVSRGFNSVVHNICMVNSTNQKKMFSLLCRFFHWNHGSSIFFRYYVLSPLANVKAYFDQILISKFLNNWNFLYIFWHMLDLMGFFNL